MSELFGPHDTLILYSFMYGPERELPCQAAPVRSMGSMAPRGMWADTRCAPHRRQIARLRASPLGHTNGGGTLSLHVHRG